MISGQPNRLGPNHGFTASAIDRSQPLSFQLNGQTIYGYAGDTILSAVLASGVTEFGVRRGEPFALSEGYAPAVTRRDAAGASAALPMARTPAFDGLELETVGPRVRRYFTSAPAMRIRHFLAGPWRTLGHDLDRPALSRNDATRDAVQIDAEVVVVGGGIAGLSAAVAAGRSGASVVLVERRSYLGGDAPFYPVLEGEPAPDEALDALLGDLASLPNVSVLTHAEAESFEGEALIVHQVAPSGDWASERLLAIRSGRFVLATGSAERLPVFPGNRSPRVIGTLAAFHRAEHYGVWLGRRATFSTCGNTAYRLPIRATDAGIDVQRVVDIRGQVVSRFIDFAKASGLQLSLGSLPYAAEPAPQGLAGLYAHFAVTFDGRPTGSPVWTDQLVVSGSFQPALELWIAAGRQCRWSREAGRIEASGELSNVRLAGAVDGVTGTMACARSGEAAVACLFGRTPAAIDDPQINPAYETPDMTFPAIRPGPGVRARPAYFDAGLGLAALEPIRTGRGISRPQQTLAAHPGAMLLGELAAAVQLGEILPSEAGGVASERCVPSLTLAPGPAEPAPVVERSPVPTYLQGRFGDAPLRWRVVSPEARQLEVGQLIFHGNDVAKPEQAVGAIVARPSSGTGAIALLGKVQIANGDMLVVRDAATSFIVRVEERLETDPV